jgi:membrane protein YqaA with SNARE-associated domain
MLRKTYDGVMALAARRDASVWLAVVAFIEGVFFPIPPDVMLMPMVMARREKAWRYAAICTLASIAGGCTGYSVGYFLHSVGDWLLAMAGHADGADRIGRWYAEWGFALLVIPIPYKLIAITSGFFHYSFPLFVGASLLIRGFRFFLVAGLVKVYGASIQAFIEKRLILVTGAVAVLLIAVFVAIKMLV